MEWWREVFGFSKADLVIDEFFGVFLFDEGITYLAVVVFKIHFIRTDAFTRYRLAVGNRSFSQAIRGKRICSNEMIFKTTTAEFVMTSSIEDTPRTSSTTKSALLNPKTALKELPPPTTKGSILTVF